VVGLTYKALVAIYQSLEGPPVLMDIHSI